MSRMEIDWDNEFSVEPEPVDPRVQEAVDKFRRALEELEGVQDFKLKEVLRKEALKLLDEAADVSLASRMKKLTEERYRPSKN